MATNPIGAFAVLFMPVLAWLIVKYHDSTLGFHPPSDADLSRLRRRSIFLHFSARNDRFFRWATIVLMTVTLWAASFQHPRIAICFGVLAMGAYVLHVWWHISLKFAK